METLTWSQNDMLDYWKIQLKAAETHEAMCKQWLEKTEKSITAIHDACVRKSDKDKNEITRIALKILSDRNEELLQAVEAINAIRMEIQSLK